MRRLGLSTRSGDHRSHVRRRIPGAYGRRCPYGVPRAGPGRAGAGRAHRAPACPSRRPVPGRAGRPQHRDRHRARRLAGARRGQSDPVRRWRRPAARGGGGGHRLAPRRVASAHLPRRRVPAAAARGPGDASLPVRARRAAGGRPRGLGRGVALGDRGGAAVRRADRHRTGPVWRDRDLRPRGRRRHGGASGRSGHRRADGRGHRHRDPSVLPAGEPTPAGADRRGRSGAQPVLAGRDTAAAHVPHAQRGDVRLRPGDRRGGGGREERCPDPGEGGRGARAPGDPDGRRGPGHRVGPGRRLPAQHRPATAAHVLRLHHAGRPVRAVPALPAGHQTRVRPDRRRGAGRLRRPQRAVEPTAVRLQAAPRRAGRPSRDGAADALRRHQPAPGPPGHACSRWRCHCGRRARRPSAGSSSPAGSARSGRATATYVRDNPHRDFDPRVCPVTGGQCP